MAAKHVINASLACTQQPSGSSTHQRSHPRPRHSLAPALQNDARAAGPYHPSMDGEGLVLFGRAANLTSTTMFADGGIMQRSVGL